MTILDQINQSKYKEVAARKQLKTIAQLEKSPFYNRKTYSLKEFLTDKTRTGIIAEFKRQSPSKGTINETADVKSVTMAYSQGGASALSVLTDSQYFGGYTQDLIIAREHNKIPILRKDFMVDSYQIHEAKAMGADVILLIAASLSVDEVEKFASVAHTLGLEVLLEIHCPEELAHINQHIDIVGINNRNLKTFSVDIQTSIDLFDKIPSEFLKISESGISSVQNILKLRNVGFSGFLIGENFMKTSNPELAFAEFVEQLKISTL